MDATVFAFEKDNYVKWTESIGAKFLQPLNIGAINKSERGVFCESNISKNSALMTIPFTSLLTIKSAVGTPCECLLNCCREDDILAFLLLKEKFVLKDNSFWYTHILQLPKSYDSIPNYSEEELAWIVGSNLYYTAQSWKTQIRNDFDDFRSVCSDRLDIELDNELYDWFTFEAYLWALCTIWSRFVTIQNESVQFRAMVPFFDMLNHKPGAPVTHFFNADKHVVLFTKDTIKRGMC